MQDVLAEYSLIEQLPGVRRWSTSYGRLGIVNN